MGYKITTTQKQAYTHFIIVIEGENTSKNTLQYLREIYKQCTKNNYKRILIEEQLEDKILGTMDIYDIVSTASTEVLGFFSAIVFVDINLDDTSNNFIETLCVNRSLPVHVFSKVEEAEKWLTRKK